MTSMWGTDVRRFERLYLICYMVCWHTCDSLLNLRHAYVGSHGYGINSERKLQHAHIMCHGLHFDHRPPYCAYKYCVFIMVTFKICLCIRVYGQTVLSFSVRIVQL